MRALCLTVGFVVLCLSSSLACAREWTDSTGKYLVQAQLLTATDTKVWLKRQDGKVISLTIAKLSKADQAFIRSQTRGAPPASDSDGDSTVKRVLT